jgi:hypothetical protein
MAAGQLEQYLAKNHRDRTIANKSVDWFRKQVRSLTGTITPNRMIQGASQFDSRPFIGRMYSYYYDPKGKETLPYFDRFPLTIVVGPAKDGFYGMNLHYLPHRFRARLLDQLLIYANNKTITEKTRLRLTYELLTASSRLRYFQPCFKHYLFNHVQTRLLVIPATEWFTAIMLPVERFVGANPNQVWRDSIRKVNG